LHILIRRHVADGHPELARPVAGEAVEAYQQIAVTAGANVAGVASGLIVLSGELGAARLGAESTAAAQAAADVMRRAEPPQLTLLGHRSTHAQALHILIRRHVADGHPELARPVAGEAVEAYQQIAVTAGANVAGVASGLIVLSGELGAAHLDAESTAAAQAAADVMRRADPPQQALLAHRSTHAQALHILIRRHLADGQPERAGPVAGEAIQAYQQIAATAGADVPGVARGLIVLSRELGAADLDAESAAAAQAAAVLQG
jgi:hypothetical protein